MHSFALSGHRRKSLHVGSADLVHSSEIEDVVSYSTCCDEINGWSCMDKDDFVRNYWQKKPLLIRGALHSIESGKAPGIFVPTRKDLLELCLDDDVESRVLFLDEGQDNSTASPVWHKASGPFDRPFLQKVKKMKTWTILVQEVDRHIPAIADIWDLFSFIPGWRKDDVMISYSSKNGGIGAHVGAFTLTVMIL